MKTTKPPPTSTSTSPPHSHSHSRSSPKAHPPPSRTFPTRFAIGGTFTQGLLVNIPQIKGHLALLDAFARFKKEVVEELDAPVPDMPEGKEKRWAWIVGLAVERFDQWVRKRYTRDKDLPLEDTLPPVDVLMVWHAYMLNPRWYAEDSARLLVLKPLIEFGHILGNELHALPPILTSPPTALRVSSFETRTGLRFDPIDDAQVGRRKEVGCLRCGVGWFVPYMTPQGTGYLQQSFAHPCARCGLSISRDALCALKLAENLARVGSAPDTFLPGTFLTDSPAASQRESDQIREAVRVKYTVSQVAASIKSDVETLLDDRTSINSETSNDYASINSNTTNDSDYTIINSGATLPDEYTTINTTPDASEWTPSPVDAAMVRAILEECMFSVAEVRGKLGKWKGLARIMSAHATHMAYSIDLVGAVLRQNSFVTKMSKLHWTDAGYFDAEADEMALRHAIARYHAFLDLLSSSPTSFFVPTLDIDLVWHTHQLTSRQYGVDCRRYVGRFVDHDDKVDGVKLSSSFDLTCRAWKERFGLPYSYCGCPLPGSTIGERLSHFFGASPTSSYTSPPTPTPSASTSSPYFHFASASGATHTHRPHQAPSSQLEPPAGRLDVRSATHASAHNLVQFKARNEKVWRVGVYRYGMHKAKLERRVKREKEKERKRDQKEGKGRDKEGKREEERRRERDGGGYGGGQAASAEEGGAVRGDVGLRGVEGHVRVGEMVVVEEAMEMEADAEGGVVGGVGGE